ncbi:hypothetical protein Aph01nite_05550 [Acrocarpospora phusangensis]|uniref:Uncharacterized protein n=1 Tax=Acrocarpospora phusangensis TaxID=1070424 RepID=A0A919Q7T1_9ACTN|nr:hypothetical protein [Acrocarpospora phusangensis]GIH22245.1 hypothetical protein Aph01nite_05550 [Acrocarpospora phusangensis]
MPSVAWTALGSPGEVASAYAGPAADVIAAGTVGGHLYLRRRVDAGWRWEHLGRPPGGDGVIGAVLLEGSLTPVVVDTDLKVWLRQTGAEPWTALAGPAPDVGLPFFADSGDLVVASRGTRHTLVMSSPAGRPWMRQGVDPDGTWFRIAADEDWITEQLAVAFAPVSGSEPQLHIFAVVRDRQTSQSGVRVAVHENAVWTWIDPAGPTPNGQHAGLTATSFRDASGRLQACAVVCTGEPAVVSMLTGSGRDWRWTDLGRPPAESSLGSAVVAAKGPDSGGEPVVVARSSHNIWTRTPTTAWTDHGGTPGDVAAVVPSQSIERADSVWTAGVSWDFDLWTFDTGTTGATGIRWEGHGQPGGLVAVIGAYTDAPEPDIPDRAVEAAVIDGHGAVWNCQVWGIPDQGFFGSSNFWAYLGPPAPGVTAADGVGVFAAPTGSPQPSWVFVVGSDGRLWASTSDATGWTWVEHGAPTSRVIKKGVAPVAVGGTPAVHVLADDGRLWMRSISGGEWRWTDRGTPDGQLIFAVLGAAVLPAATGPLPVAAVAAGDGHLWLSVPAADGFRWVDLGTPTPSERVVATVGVEVVAQGLDIVVAGSPSGQVWSRRWSPQATGAWIPHGRPLDARIRAAVGTARDPADPASCLAWVIGNDQQIWVTSSAGGPWSRWDPVFPVDAVTAGKSAFVMDAFPCVVALDNGPRLHVVTPEL